MTSRFSMPLRVAAVTATAAVVSAMAAFPAAAADGDVRVVNTETVQVYTSPTGEVETMRVYEQLALTGNGSVDLKNPISTDGLRNLDGFGGFDVEDGQQITNVSVDGEKRLRSVSDFTGKLPLDVSVEYYLDGKRVEPGDVVGEDGKLEVKYIVKNVTGVDQEVSFPDGMGGTVTKTVSVPIPMVGSLTTTTPPNFTNVQSGQANMAGDGKGGTKLSFTMTLFPPIGSDTAEFGYTANISDGVVPRTSISALPVNPLESPTFKTAADSYKGGADTGIQLTDGAAQIDTNLLKLRDGASDLLAGLIKLRDGAQQLEAGLAGEAAPGANLLAAGASELKGGTEQLFHGTGELVNGTGQLKAGAAELNGGAGRLAAGADELKAGAFKLRDGGKLLASKMGEAAAGGKKLHAGAGQLADGAKKAAVGGTQISDGAHELAVGLTTAGQKAPALLAGLGELKKGLLLVDGGLQQLSTEIGGLSSKAQPLRDGIDDLEKAIGTTSTPGTILYGVDQVRTGLQGAIPKLEAMAAGVYSNDPTSPGSYQKLGCAVAVLTALSTGDPIDRATGCFAKLPAEADLDGDGEPELVTALGAEADPLRRAMLDALVSDLQTGRQKLATANGDVNETTLYGGLRTIVESFRRVPEEPNDKPGAIPALTALECGLDSTSLGATCRPLMGEKPGLLQGLGQIDAGVSQLVSGVVGAVQAAVGTSKDVPANRTLRGGTNGLIAGVDLLSSGGGELLAGLGQLSDGATKLDAGAGELSTGLGALSAGSGELVKGSGTLADGLGQLSGGAAELSKGAGKVAVGAGALADGARQLRDGTGRLVDGVSELDSGALRLRDGAGQLDDGAGRLADGANELADGLKDAADGSGQLAGGLEEAAAGAPKLVDGAQRLSDEGTSKLVEAGDATAQNYGEMYATIQAGAERAQAEDMAYGAPEGAIGLTAYSFEIKGDDGEGGRNWTRGLAGLAVLAAGAGAFALRRRVI